MSNPRMSAADAELHVLDYLQAFGCDGADEARLNRAMGCVGDDYPNGPYPLETILQDLERKDEVERVKDFTFRLTEKGRERLAGARSS